MLYFQTFVPLVESLCDMPVQDEVNIMSFGGDGGM